MSTIARFLNFIFHVKIDEDESCYTASSTIAASTWLLKLFFLDINNL